MGLPDVKNYLFILVFIQNSIIMDNNNGNGLGLGEISTIRNILMGDQMAQVNSTIEDLNKRLADMEKNFEKKISSMEKAYEGQMNKMKETYESKIKALEDELSSKTIKIQESIVAEKKDDRNLLSDLFAQISDQLKKG